MIRKRLPKQIIFTLIIAFVSLFAEQSYIRFYWTQPELRHLETTIDSKMCSVLPPELSKFLMN